ncbi:hypothetical protein [Nocardiopsis lambiniae]|uniref:DUF8129 domain-containing protein n=1 Tax=Nocardiopsis lambiniae TaxID=3075539 RepID=A0ABU2M5I9_9ACTN|nr:hypothetical protein [Nocardiopsis sp. DSM 44743]MDT0327915.1 hypothetical protein [Nocardiopsis sp. DSM 44743]
MSNPTIATKVVTLFKGLFGRKETVPTPAEEKTAPAESAATEATATVETPVAEAPKTEEPAAQEKVAEPVEDKAEPVEDKAAEKAETPVVEVPVAEAPAAEEPVTPATADLTEPGETIAEEIAAAEAKTEVADTEVLEKVRKENAPAVEDLAVPTYDALTLPSVRARLRKLTIAQVRDLRAYEVAHQGRAEFIRMYDNRIAKLETEA